MDLFITHRAFYWGEPRAYDYDKYMKSKDWEKWTDSVPMNEISKLFDFIILWDFHFQGDPKQFQKIYEELSPIIKELEQARLESIDFSNELLTNIGKVFDRVAECSWKYESTDGSKILHTMLPNLFVMWDRRIRKGILGREDKNWGAVYAIEFLPKMQKEINEAIETLMQEKGLNRKEAIKCIHQMCDNKTLPKLIDEHNYMICTRPKDFREFIGNLRKKGEMTSEEYERLANKV